MNTLRGPADPNAFRTSHYGARWYHDPLPSCDLAAETQDKWPAVSTLKRAWSKEFRKRWTDGNTYGLDALRVALYVEESLESLSTMPTDVRVPLMAGAAKRDLNRAAQRGTNVHTALELLAGGDEMQAKLAAGAYFDVCNRLLTELSPSVDFAEVVAISRTLGAGGTIDSILRIGDRRYVIDWKTRGDDSNHGAYEAEAVQLGCYSLADYLVADVDGTARRVAVPELDGGLVISIKTDSYEVYPVDLAGAIEGARALAETWKARRAGEKAARACIGKPVLLGAVTFANPERSTWVKDRIGELAGHDEAKALVASKWPLSNTKGPWTDRDIDAIDTVLREAERLVIVPFPEPDPAIEVPAPVADLSTSPVLPDLRPMVEGPVVDDVSDLVAAVADLTDPQRARCAAWTRDGVGQGRPWAIGSAPTERTVAINRAAIGCAAAFIVPDDAGNEALVRHALHLAIGEELQPSWLTGAVLGSLTKDEAVLLAGIAERFAAGDSDVTHRLGEMVAEAA